MGLKNAAIRFNTVRNSSEEKESFEFVPAEGVKAQADDLCNNRSFVLYEKLKYAGNYKLM